MAKEYLANEFDLLRTQEAMICKISPETADYLSSGIKICEDSSRNLIAVAKDMSVKKLPPEQLITTFGLSFIELLSSYTKLHDIIKLCRNCIYDTLKRLE